MRLETMRFAPLRLAASALKKVARLRLHDAGIALRQALEARITMPLGKAFFSRSTAVSTSNSAAPMKRYRLAYAPIEGDVLIPSTQMVTHLVTRPVRQYDRHLA